MKTLAVSLILLSALNGSSHDPEISATLKDYIRWTTTGQCDAYSRIFSNPVKLSYLDETNEFKDVLFEEYAENIKNAANTIPRSMNIKSLNIKDNVAKVIITDCSPDYSFSLVHVLSLVKNNDSWKINSIQIASRDFLKELEQIEMN